MLRRGINDTWVERRKYDGKGPLPAFGKRGGRFSREESRINLDVLGVTVAAVETREQSSLAACIKDVGVRRIGSNITALAASGRIHHRSGAKPARGRVARYTNSCIVLLRATDVVGNVARGCDVIKLGRRI